MAHFSTVLSGKVQYNTQILFNLSIINNKHFQTVQQFLGQKSKMFDCVGCSRWLYQSKIIHSPKMKGTLRKAIFFDHKRHISITVWGI